MSESSEISRLAKAVRNLRKDRGMSQYELSARCCERSLLSHFENGDFKAPSLLIVREIAQRLGYTVDELLTIADMGSAYCNGEVRRRVIVALFNQEYERVKNILDNNAKWRYQVSDDQFFRYAYARYYYHQGQVELAKDMFLEAIRYTNPGVSLVKPTPKEYLSYIWYLICEVDTDYSVSKFPITFDTQLNKITDTICDSYTICYNYQYIEICYYLAILFEKMKQYDKALFYGEVAIKYVQSGHDYAYMGCLYFVVGRCLNELGRNAAGKDMLRQALQFYTLTNDNVHSKDLKTYLNELEAVKI